MNPQEDPGRRTLPQEDLWNRALRHSWKGEGRGGRSPQKSRRKVGGQAAAAGGVVEGEGPRRILRGSHLLEELRIDGGIHLRGLRWCLIVELLVATWDSKELWMVDGKGEKSSENSPHFQPKWGCTASLEIITSPRHASVSLSLFAFILLAKRKKRT